MSGLLVVQRRSHNGLVQISVVVVERAGWYSLLVTFAVHGPAEDDPEEINHYYAIALVERHGVAGAGRPATKDFLKRHSEIAVVARDAVRPDVGA